MCAGALTIAFLALLPAGLPTGAQASDQAVRVADFGFAPASLTLNPGDTVSWRFAGPDTNHTVSARPGQADSFESDLGKTEFEVQHPVGDRFAHRFATPGAFRYLCRVHPSMTGRVTVVAVPDTTAPRVSSVEAAAPRLRFKLSEKAGVTALVKRGRKTVKLLRIRGRKGSNSVRFPPRGLRAGRYRLTLAAEDALGNESKALRRSFSVAR